MHSNQDSTHPTEHYRIRALQRALHSDVEEFVMTWGTETLAAGATYLTVVRRHLPPEIRDTELAVRATGWIIIMLEGGALLTCYRRADAWRFIRLRSEMNRRRRHLRRRRR
jgi:hypothetical protein